MGTDLKDLSPEDITKFVGTVTTLIALAQQLSSFAAAFIARSEAYSAIQKEELIEKIRSAQASVPKWED